MNVLRFRSRSIRLTLGGLAVAILVGPTAASSAT
jgi:hypothetical protein